MYERPHHRRIAALLGVLDATKLAAWECYFGGGTAVTLALGEYRESVDVDFLCSSAEGYRQLRAAVFDGRLDGLTRAPLVQIRDLRSDQYGVRTFVEVEGAPIRLEFVREARIELSGAVDASLGLAVLTHEDLFAEKLLANADRHLDAATSSRDAIDLAMMTRAWGPAPAESWKKARAAYGDTVDRALAGAIVRFRDDAYRTAALRQLAMDVAMGPIVLSGLEQLRTAATPS
jgi:hypothetical protein